jgi:hypothetical protein
MSYKPRYDSGSWKVICDECGREFKSHELQMRWDGLMVCSGDWEPRQPQDFVHGVADIQAPPYTRPESADTFAFVCTPITSQGMADYGTADCAAADINNHVFPECTFEGNSCVTDYAISGCSVAGNPYPGEAVTIPPEPPLTYHYCSARHIVASAGYATAGCARVSVL